MHGAERILFKGPIFHFISLIVLAFVVYSNTFHVPFVFDDEESIVTNPVIRGMNNFLLNGSGYLYNPRRFIGYLTVAFNYAIGGLDVTGYHIFNLAVHIINALLVYSLVRLTFRTPNMKGSSLYKVCNEVALLTAVLFVIHPVQTEAVTYVIQRVTSLATMFFLAALCFYIRFRLSEETGDLSKGKSFLLYALVLVMIVLSMKTKEIAFTLPVVIVLYEFFFFKPKKRALLFLVPIILTLFIIPYSLLDIRKPLGDVLSDVSEVTKVQSPVSRWDYLLTQFSVIVTYIRLLFFPINQNLDYDYPVYRSFLIPRVFLSSLFLLGLVVIAAVLFISSRRNSDKALRMVSFGILWFFITLSVESSVVPITDVIFEHRVYLPSVGAFSAIVPLIFLLIGRRLDRMISAFIFLALIGLFLSGTAYMRNTIWQSGMSLWQDVVKKSPGKARGHNNLGFKLESEGHFVEAIENYKTAIRLKPDYAEAYNNLGNTLETKGLIDEAIKDYETAIRLRPGYAKAYNNLGVAYISRGLVDRAEEYFQSAVRLDPGYADAYNNLGNVYRTKGLFEEAMTEYRIAIGLKPAFPEAHFGLGLIYLGKGETGKARSEFETVLKINPNFIPARHVLNDLEMKK